ncbi:hypothetical protein KNP414_07611 [Paenibacillus mucilaginosus KNP414]|uniref:Uncharacterized protein n=1 Tax=Paenibacillus mucilaginosus (strain KNP414) TaxID=1036673 RepID=F8FCL0_PAEMK|nr:hypothetical protein KNP414_07611 [Paenibacillus mucilaginosus KNP414]
MSHGCIASSSILWRRWAFGAGETGLAAECSGSPLQGAAYWPGFFR